MDQFEELTGLELLPRQGVDVVFVRCTSPLDSISYMQVKCPHCRHMILAVRDVVRRLFSCPDCTGTVRTY